MTPNTTVGAQVNTRYPAVCQGEEKQVRTSAHGWQNHGLQSDQLPRRFGWTCCCASPSPAPSQLDRQLTMPCWASPAPPPLQCQAPQGAYWRILVEVQSARPAGASCQAHPHSCSHETSRPCRPGLACRCRGNTLATCRVPVNALQPCSASVDGDLGTSRMHQQATMPPALHNCSSYALPRQLARAACWSPPPARVEAVLSHRLLPQP